MISKNNQRKFNPLLLNVLTASAVVHILLGIVLGGITVVRYLIPDEAQFEEPPKSVEEQPPPDVKIEIKPQPRSTEQPMRNLQTRQVGNITIAEIAVDLPSMGDSFSVKSSDVGAFKNSSKLMNGSRKQLELGTSQVNVFGIKAQAERILFIIDTNRQMLSDKKGGLNSYRVIKEEITEMVANLNTGTLFNVMLKDGTKTILFKPKLITAGSKSHSELVKWITPINSNAQKPGLDAVKGAKRPSLRTLTKEEVHKALLISGRGNGTVFITQYALEQDIDTVFFITGYHQGFEDVRRDFNEKEKREWQAITNRKEYKQQMAQHQEEKPQMVKRVSREMNRINSERKAKGMPPRVLASPGFYAQVNELGLKWKTQHPGSQPRVFEEPRDVKKYMSKLNDELYEKFEKPVPSINVVLFLAKDEAFNKQANQRLSSYVRFFNGKHRIIRGEAEIKSARTTSKSKN